MPIIDLVTPWAADPEGFTTRSHPAIETIRRQRSPTEPRLPPPASFDGLTARARDPSFQQRLRDTRDRLVDRGLAAPARILLVASAAPGGTAEPLPDHNGGAVALFIDRADDREILRALGGAMAALTRWSQPVSPVAAQIARGNWDRWIAARDVPLVEWIYSAGVVVHARALVEPDAPPEVLLGVARGNFRRLRRDERALIGQLNLDLPQSGVGVVMRWLEDDAPPALRRGSDGNLIPSGAGRYLAWRELADRVARVGVVEACAMAVF
jgi:hypothetical protein